MTAVRRLSRHRTVAVLALLAAGGGLIYSGLTAPRAAHVDLYAEGVAIASSGEVVTVEVGVEPYLHPGTRVLTDPATTQDEALADAQRAWLASGEIPGADGLYSDLVTAALLDLNTLTVEGGATVAGWSTR